MTDIEKLKALALAASKGPWCYGENYADNGALAGYNLYAEDGYTLIGEDIGPSEKDIAFMAEANPAAVLELIAEVERLRAEKEAPDLHVIPPPRGTGSQQDACDALLSACRKGVVALAHAADNPMYMEAYGALSSAIEAEVASRGRAQGGNTSETAGAGLASKGAETRMDTSSCAGAGPAPAAGTDAAAETMDHAQLQALGQHQEKP